MYETGQITLTHACHLILIHTSHFTSTLTSYLTSIQATSAWYIQLVGIACMKQAKSPRHIHATSSWYTQATFYWHKLATSPRHIQATVPRFKQATSPGQIQPTSPWHNLATSHWHIQANSPETHWSFWPIKESEQSSSYIAPTRTYSCSTKDCLQDDSIPTIFDLILWPKSLHCGRIDLSGLSR